MNSVKHHHHAPHAFDRITKVEEWIVRLAVPAAFVAMGAALVYGVLNSTGHITW